MSEATGIEALVCADIARRQALGIAKYGQTVAENPLSLREWLEHAYEEALDLAVYLRRAMEEMENLNTCSRCAEMESILRELVAYCENGSVGTIGADHVYTRQINVKAVEKWKRILSENTQTMASEGLPSVDGSAPRISE